jgi:hypothetical protein
MRSLFRVTQLVFASATIGAGALCQGPIISSTYLTTINVAKQQLKVYPDTQNWANDNLLFPNRWLFAVQPALMPELDGDAIAIKQKELERHTKPVPAATDHIITTRVGLTIRVSDERVIREAVQAITEYYKDKPYTFDDRQVSTIPIKKVEIEFDSDAAPGCKLKNREIPVSSADSAFVIWIDCEDHKLSKWPDVNAPDSAVSQLKNHLDILNVVMTITYDARRADVSVVTFKAGDLKNTTLYAKLVGDGGEAYVSRDDLRNLAMEAGKNIYIGYHGHKPPTDLVNDFVNKLLDSALTVSVDAESFNKEMLSQTYKAEDVDPNEINRTFDNLIDKSSSEDKVNFSTGGNVGILSGVFEAGGHLDGADFKKRMSEKQVTAEFNGKKWICKKVDIKRVNISKFAQTFQGNWSDASVDAASPYAEEKRQIHFEGVQLLPPPNKSTSMQSGPPFRDLLLRSHFGFVRTSCAVSPEHLRTDISDEPVGCCCLLKDAGPRPNWDCTGTTDGTLITKKQCKIDADDGGGVKWKWHEGKCTGDE